MQADQGQTQQQGILQRRGDLELVRAAGARGAVAAQEQNPAPRPEEQQCVREQRRDVEVG